MWEEAGPRVFSAIFLSHAYRSLGQQPCFHFANGHNEDSEQKSIVVRAQAPMSDEIPAAPCIHSVGGHEFKT